MIRYFCDTCNKDITDEKQFKCAIIYETKSKYYNRKVASRKDFCLCEECNNKMVGKLKEIF